MTKLRSELELSTIRRRDSIQNLASPSQLLFYADISPILGACDAMARNLILVYNHNFSSFEFLLARPLRINVRKHRRGRQNNESTHLDRQMQAPSSPLRTLTEVKAFCSLPARYVQGVLATPMPITIKFQIYFIFSFPI